MFWIICLIVFLVLCTAIALIARKRTGNGSGIEDVNHTALQQGAARIYNRNISGGPFGGGPTI